LRRLAVTVLVLALLAATTAAFALTEALKLEGSPVTRPQFDRIFSPTCACPQEIARLGLRLRRADTIDAVIVDADGAPVRTLVSGSRRVPGRLLFLWNGRSDADAVVPDGEYRLRVHFADERRTIVIPNVIRVDTLAPTVELVRLSPQRLSPDGDGRRDRARVEFRLSEPARPLLLVDGAVAVEGRRHAAGTAELAWPETAYGSRLQAGLYGLALQAQDRAGNVSAPTDTSIVHIRYIELARATLQTRRSGVLRFRVLTDARRFRWTLLGRGGKANRPLLTGTATRAHLMLRLPKRIRPGRYVLRVTAQGHGDQAAVIVRARR
jgi:FlgD Ig-like domain